MMVIVTRVIATCPKVTIPRERLPVDDFSSAFLEPLLLPLLLLSHKVWRLMLLL